MYYTVFICKHSEEIIFGFIKCYVGYKLTQAYVQITVHTLNIVVE